MIRLHSIDSAIVQTIEPIEHGQSIERNQAQDPNRTQDPAIEYYPEIGRSITIRLRFDCVQQSNRNYSIKLDCVGLVQLRFSIDIVWLSAKPW